MKKKVNIIVPKDIILELIIAYLVVCEFLPIINVINPIVLSMGKIFASGIFLLIVFEKNRKLAIEFSIILGIAILVSFWAFYHCWINYTSLGNFVIKNTLCWLYMEIGIYIMQYASVTTKIFIRNLILLLVCVTATTSIIALQSMPTAVRELGNGSKNIKGMETMLYQRNTSTWGELYGMVFLLPFIIQWFKQTKKIILLFIIVILETCIFASQITFAILISLFFLIFLILKPLTFRQIIIFAPGFLAIGMIIMNFIGPVLDWLYDIMSKTNNEVLTMRIHQLYVLFVEQEMTGTIEGRYDLYMRSIETFFKNPIIGYKLRDSLDYAYIGLHSQIFDLLASVGMIGFVPMTCSFIFLIKKIVKRIENRNIYRYFLLSIIMLLLLMLVNTTYYASCIYMSVFLGPGLIYQLKKESISKGRECICNRFAV